MIPFNSIFLTSKTFSMAQNFTFICTSEKTSLGSKTAWKPLLCTLITGFWGPVGITFEKESWDEGLQCETYHCATQGPKPPECRHSDQQQQYQQRYDQERSVGLKDRAEKQIRGGLWSKGNKHWIIFLVPHSNPSGWGST